MSFRRILLAHDLSDASDEAMHLAVDLAKRHRASLAIVHVYAIPVIPMPEGYVMQAPSTVVEIQRATQAGLEALRERALDLGAPSVTIDATAGAPADGILAAARAGGFDLIVMGTHGRRGLSRMILGSVAEAVLRRAPCPVLTVHPAPAEVAADAPR
jgi:nucleotide-binding universal stress UspA family protein